MASGRSREFLFRGGGFQRGIFWALPLNSFLPFSDRRPGLGDASVLPSLGPGWTLDSSRSLAAITVTTDVSESGLGRALNSPWSLVAELWESAWLPLVFAWTVDSPLSSAAVPLASVLAPFVSGLTPESLWPLTSVRLEAAWLLLVSGPGPLLVVSWNLDFPLVLVAISSILAPGGADHER